MARRVAKRAAKHKNLVCKSTVWPGLIRHYAPFLPLKSKHLITLLEGNTPLVEAPRLAEAISYPGQLFLKVEGQNPTGSFKDRGMTYAVSQALAENSRAVICASTGNTAASAAAYAARAGLKTLVLIPAGQVALGKLSQAAMHGAEIIQIRGNFDMALSLVLSLAKQSSLTLVNSLNPFRIEGQKTAAFEVCDALGQAPTYHALPVGNAGNITAYWKGYREYQKVKRFRTLPRMLGFQAEGAAPIVRDKVVEHPETVATAIRIGNPASWKGAKAALGESKGHIAALSDEEILEAYDLIARCEGIFVEPASAAAVAGVRALAREGFFRKGDVTVCTLTGHGLKDPQTALSRDFVKRECEPDLSALLKILQASLKG